MYLFKKIVGALGMPLNVVLLLLVVAAVLRWRRRPRAALWVAGSAAAFLYLCALEPVANGLLGPLETRFPPLNAAAYSPRFVVVLGSGYAPRDGLPVTAVLDSNGLARIVEGVALLRHWPQASLIVSGGAPAGMEPPAHGYELLARELGVDAGRIVVLDHALDTAGEARDLAPVVGAAEFVLVTSAFHLPRAMAHMRQHGLHAIAAPTAHQFDSTSRFNLASLVPRTSALQRCGLAIHEYLGLLALEIGIG